MAESELIERQPPRHFTPKERFNARRVSKSVFSKMNRDIEKRFSADSKENVWCENEPSPKLGTCPGETLKILSMKVLSRFEKLSLFGNLL